jgi:hypothetical protein
MDLTLQPYVDKAAQDGRLATMLASQELSLRTGGRRYRTAVSSSGDGDAARPG